MYVRGFLKLHLCAMDCCRVVKGITPNLLKRTKNQGSRFDVESLIRKRFITQVRIRTQDFHFGRRTFNLCATTVMAVDRPTLIDIPIWKDRPSRARV